MTDTADALEALKAYQAAVSACLMVGGVAPNDTDPNNWWMMMVAALSPDVVKALIARVERAEAALRAWRDWDLAEDASLELHERADAEDWRNDPTGSMHLHSAVQRANDKQGTAIALRDTALAALEAS